MEQPYGKETRRIVDDLLAALGAKEGIDSAFLEELKVMAGGGMLDNRGRVRQAIANLEAEEDGLHD